MYATKIHSIGYLFHRFKGALARAPAELQTVLTKLCLLYGLYAIAENSGPFLQYGYFTPQQVGYDVFLAVASLTYDHLQLDWIRASVTNLCKDIRNNAIPLTDSFDYSDFMLNSPLGRADGNIYEAYFGMVQKAHKAGAIPKYFQKEVGISTVGYHCLNICSAVFFPDLPSLAP